MNRPLETDANPADDMAVTNGDLENMGNIPVPKHMRVVAIAMAVSWVNESLPEPSVIQSSR